MRPNNIWILVKFAWVYVPKPNVTATSAETVAIICKRRVPFMEKCFLSSTLRERQGPLFQEDALSKRRCPAFLPERAPALFPFQHKHRMADRRTLKLLK